MFKFERTGKKAKKPDMTPLIDIIFQLILFFMLTTTFVKIEAIDIFVSSKAAAPEAPTHIDHVVTAPLVINLKGDKLFINNNPVNATALPDIIGKETKLQNNRNIRILTQEGVTMQQLVNVVDLVRAGGGVNITLDSSDISESINASGQVEPPQKIPLPELQSTKTHTEKMNSGSFNFDGSKGWMPDQ
jgi:biopolymer transport protein ExbD